MLLLRLLLGQLEHLGEAHLVDGELWLSDFEIERVVMRLFDARAPARPTPRHLLERFGEAGLVGHHRRGCRRL
ncbi:MAG: hypothetical protein HC923_11870 [Myxococcales bacterium]|nr:hypothetical protein [Myxococcales bacterium]